MTEPYIVAQYGTEWFVIHVPTRSVTCRCSTVYYAEGIAKTGNELGIVKADEPWTEGRDGVTD